MVDDPKQALYPKTSPAYQLNFNGQPARLNPAIQLMHSMRERALEMMTVPIDFPNGAVNSG